jgi:hypothetical protein
VVKGLGYGNVWIGLNDRGLGNEGDYEWSSGAGYSYKAWCPNEPNNSGVFGEDCVMMNFCANGGWNDGSCDVTLPFACEAGL